MAGSWSASWYEGSLDCCIVCNCTVGGLGSGASDGLGDGEGSGNGIGGCGCR